MSSEYVYGKNSVVALLERSPERVFKVLVADGHKPDKRLDTIYRLAQERGISLQRVPRQKLETLLASVVEEEGGVANHQGVLASVSPKPLLDLHDLIAACPTTPTEAGGYPLLLMLDGVTDPRNFGAILRVADAAGVQGVVVAKHQSAGFGPSVAKAASGAEESVPVAVVPNLVQAMEKLQQAGFWTVGTALGPKAVLYHQQDFKMPTVLLLGSEGKGLSRLVQERCDFLVTIPMVGLVDSLNVAAATAVLVFEARRQQQQAGVKA